MLTFGLGNGGHTRRFGTGEDAMRPTMGDVIQLPIRKKQDCVWAEKAEISSAQIMLFTGVRYQRMTDFTPPEAGGKGAPTEGGMSGKRKRKRS